MPDAREYLKGFNIKRGLELAGYQLSQLSIQHIEEVRYREYSYPMKFVFIPQGQFVNPNELLQEFRRYVSGQRVIYTQYGNPYVCTFGNPEITNVNNGIVTIESQGAGVRSFDIPKIESRFHRR